MIVEIKMIRWVCRYMRLNRIRNEMVREKVGVSPIEDKIRETRLKWFGCIKRRSENVLVRRIRNDSKLIGLKKDITQDIIYRDLGLRL